MSALQLKIIRTFLTAGILQNLNTVGLNSESSQLSKLNFQWLRSKYLDLWDELTFLSLIAVLILLTKMLLSKFTREHISFLPCKGYIAYRLFSIRMIHFVINEPKIQHDIWNSLLRLCPLLGSKVHLFKLQNLRNINYRFDWHYIGYIYGGNFA